MARLHILVIINVMFINPYILLNAIHFTIDWTTKTKTGRKSEKKREKREERESQRERETKKDKKWDTEKQREIETWHKERKERKKKLGDLKWIGLRCRRGLHRDQERQRAKEGAQIWKINIDREKGRKETQRERKEREQIEWFAVN